MESIRITIHKLDFFDNITKVGRIVIYEFTTPFTGLVRAMTNKAVGAVAFCVPWSVNQDASLAARKPEDGSRIYEIMGFNEEFGTDPMLAW
jgi:hypothetical protein